MRTRAERRHNDFKKAIRKRNITRSVYWDGWNDGKNNYDYYDNLHQYSKNKIHCSCPWCSPRTRNKGLHRNTKNYAPSINYSIMDKRRQMAMDEDEKEFFN